MQIAFGFIQEYSLYYEARGGGIIVADVELRKWQGVDN